LVPQIAGEPIGVNDDHGCNGVGLPAPASGAILAGP
jgi:hypothetical protein